MDYDAYITELTDVLKQDKSVVQPWRNKSVARLQEVQAFIRMGKSTTNRKPDDHPAMQFAGPTQSQCICTPGMPPRKDCPVHGSK